MRLTILGVLGLMCVASGAVAQQSASTTAMSGSVVHAGSGLPLAFAEVRLSGPITAVRTTDARGQWRATGLPSGAYQVRVRLLGYRIGERMVRLVSDAPARITMALEPTVLPLDDVVITAARRSQRLADVPVATEVLSREEIERSGASDLSAVLTEHTGVDLQGGHPNGAGIMLQGIGAERVLILLDGQPIAGRIAGVFDISRIPVAVVERVEIVKGPQSTLYGSEAMGGVVNIITRTPGDAPWSGHLALAAGSQQRRDATAGVGVARGALSLGADVNWRTIENTPGRGQSAGALAERTDGLVTLRWTPTDRTRVDASVLALDERQRWRSGTQFAFADNQQWNGRIGGSWRSAGGRHAVSSTLAASTFDHLSRGSVADKPIAGDTGQRQIQQTAKAELLYNATFSPGRAGLRALDLGVEIEREATESDRVQGRHRTLISAEPFTQVELGGAAWSVLPGLRLTWNEQWGTHLTPRLASRVRLTEAVTLRASAGTGFRAPDFKELYMFFQNESANYAVVGNESLRPERSRNLSTSLEWSGWRGYARTQLFWNEFRDFIETSAITAPGAPPVFRYANVDDGATRGAEIEAGVHWRALRIEGGLNLLDTEDRTTGAQLLGRPSRGARMTLGLDALGGTRASLSTVYTGRTPMQRDESTGGISSWRDAYLRTDVRVAREVVFGVDLAFGIDNLFDARPEQWAAFTGRHLYTALSWQADAR